MPIRVLVVDDSAVMRNVLREALGSDPEIEVVGSASSAEAARSAIQVRNPDVITLDINMPGTDGLTFLQQLMRLRPSRVVMVSSLTLAGADATLRALEMGAVDFAAKPSAGEGGIAAFQAEILNKVKSAATAHVPWAALQVPHEALPTGSSSYDRLVALGGSTGAVSALEYIIGALPGDAPALAIAVHMPAPFTNQFANRLNKICAMKVVEAEDGMPIEQGCAYIAPGDFHFTVVRNGGGFRCRVASGERVGGFRPSVDVLLSSVALTAGPDAVGIILTGLGRDGAVGLKAMRAAGARTACQDEKTSLIYGMPGAAIAAGAAETELPLSGIPGYLLASARIGRRSTLR